MDATTLHQAVAEVCPVTGVTVVDADDRSTWSYTPTAAATQAEKDAADNVIQTIPVDQVIPPPPSPPAAALYDHEARIAALEGAPVLDSEAYLKKRGLDGR